MGFSWKSLSGCFVYLFQRISRMLYWLFVMAWRLGFFRWIFQMLNFYNAYIQSQKHFTAPQSFCFDLMEPRTDKIFFCSKINQLISVSSNLKREWKRTFFLNVQLVVQLDYVIRADLVFKHVKGFYAITVWLL